METPKKLLKLRLIVDQVKKKVIFAESGIDFVDILFNFLTMPLGSVIHLLNKQSLLGCMDKLYESIENMDVCYFNTEACKEMLLRPLNASGGACEDLILGIDESKHQTFSYWKKPECHTKTFPCFSLQKARSQCGEIINFLWGWKKKEHRGPNGDDDFSRFTVYDDLCIMPSSTFSMNGALEKFGVNDFDAIEATSLDLDAHMVQDLLKRSLTSKTPLSDMYFKKTDMAGVPAFHLEFPNVEEANAERNYMKVKANLIICKSTNMILYIESDEGFVDLLLSFLTFPLVSIFELLNLGCIDNFYKSLDDLSSYTKHIKPAAFKLMLDHPKLGACFGPNNSLRSSSEKKNFNFNILPDCRSCFMSKYHVGPVYDFDTLEEVEHAKRRETNSKLFLITRDLQIKPFSAVECLEILNRNNVAKGGFFEKEIDVDKTDALNLLRSCLTSLNPFGDVFEPKMQRKWFY